MRLKRLFSAALSAALLIGFCACAPNETVESSSPSASADVLVIPSPMPGHTTPPSVNTASLPPLPPPPEYDKSYRLDAEIPALINGLEMPISGATGYTSVELPVWPSNPNKITEPDPTEEPSEPEPSPSAPPAESDPPEESSEPVSEPPAETDDPAGTEPGPSQYLDIPSEPVPSEDPEPTATPEPTPEPTPTPAPTPEPTPTPEPEPTGTPDPYANAVAVWEPGTAFVILGEDGDWWYVSRGNEYGWIEHRYCMINLPDVIPSIIYNDTNAYSSLFVTSGKDIPGVTGKAFYNSLAFNDRLDRQEFMMPILYSAARNICAAQHKALAEGNCLVIYQTFRPYQTQIDVANAVRALANTDPEVKAGISTSPWSIDWFIATGVSNHQMGYALDVSMVKVYATETRYIGSRPYLRMTDYEDYEMPTPMHELSYASRSSTAPNGRYISETMNEPALALRNYFTSSGLSPLPSEWWHFNDNNAMRAASARPSNGKYYITECLSCPPEWVSGLLLD